jgi:hypothetical protein
MNIHTKTKRKTKRKTRNTSRKTTVKKNKNCILDQVSHEKHFNSNYLQNNICKFIPLFDFDPNIKKNIISTCFFKMRTGGYKSFDNYLNGINKLHEYAKTHLSDFKIRMFIDLSIYNDTKLMTTLQKLENLELVLYCCDAFARDEIYHLGVFGTLIRAFPMFDFPNNDANRIMVADIDFNHKNIQTIDGYKYYDSIYSKDEFDSFYLMTLRKNRIYKVFNYTEMIVKNKYIKPYVLFDSIITIKKIPNNIIVNFINNQEKYKTTHITYFLTDAAKKKKCDEYMCFGLDEYFLNSILIPFIITKKLPILLNIKFNIMYIITVFHYIYLSDTFINKKLKNVPNKPNPIKTKIRKYLYFITNGLCKSKDVSKCYQFCLNLFYNSAKKEDKPPSELKDDLHKLIIKRFVQLVYMIAKNKDYSIIPKDFIDICLSKQFMGYFSRNMIITYNTNFKNIEDQEENVKVDLSKEEIDRFYSVTDKKRYNLLI